MTKSMTWIVVGLLVVAGLGALAFTQLAPRPDRAAAAADASTVGAKGGSAATAPVAAVSSNVAGPAPTPAPAPSAPAATPTIDDLIQNAAAYDGATVSLTGLILTQCTAGCEFALSDDTGVLSVQLEGKAKDRLIPLGKVGKKIAVQGVFRASPRPQVVVEDPNGWQLVK